MCWLVFFCCNAKEIGLSEKRSVSREAPWTVTSSTTATMSSVLDELNGVLCAPFAEDCPSHEVGMKRFSACAERFGPARQHNPANKKFFHAESIELCERKAEIQERRRARARARAEQYDALPA